MIDPSQQTHQARSRIRSRKLSANILAGLGGRAATAAISVVSVPLLISALGVDRYGLYMTITAVSGWVSIGTLGLGKGLVNAIVDAHARGDERLARGTLASLWLGLAILLAAMGIAFGLAFPFVPWTRVFPSSAPELEVSRAVLLTVGFALLGLFLSPVFTVFSAYQDERKATVFSVLRNATTLIAVGLASAFQLGMAGYAAVSGLLVTVVNASAIYFLLGRDRPFLRPTASDFSLPLLKSVLFPSLSFFLIDLAAILAFQIDRFLILQYSQPSDVTQFDVAARMFLLAFSLHQVIQGPMWPAMGEALRRGDGTWARRTLRRTALVSGLVLACLTLLALLVGDDIVALWTRRSDLHVPRAVFLAIGTYFTTRVVTDTHTVALFSLGRQREVLVSAVAHGALSLTLGLWMGSRWGFAGIAWSSTIALLATAAWWIPLRTWSAIREV